MKTRHHDAREGGITMKTSKHTCLTLRIALTILGAVLTYFLWQREGSLLATVLPCLAMGCWLAWRSHGISPLIHVILLLVLLSLWFSLSILFVQPRTPALLANSWWFHTLHATQLYLGLGIFAEARDLYRERSSR